MKIENILFWVIMLSMLAYSCTKELPPSFLAGKYKAFNFEVEDCNDISKVVSVDFSIIDTIYKLGCEIDTIGCDTFQVPDSVFMNMLVVDSLGVRTEVLVFDSIRIETVIDCETQLINCTDVTFNEVTMEIDSLGNYELIIDKVVDGVPEIEQTNGEYISTGFNDINFCVTDCLDSLWHPGLFVRTNNGEVNISWRDTLSSQCGFLFQGDRIN